MKRLTLRTSLVLSALTCALVIGAPAVPAQAGPADAILGLATDAVLDGRVLTVTATGSFDGGIVANNAVFLQVAGTETYVDGGIPITVPIVGAPFAIRFANRNTVVWEWFLSSSASTVHIDWTAEASGLAPTPFLGSCAGTFSFVGMTEAEFKTC